jgi:hypothetical protein
VDLFKVHNDVADLKRPSSSQDGAKGRTGPSDDRWELARGCGERVHIMDGNVAHSRRCATL